MNHFARNKMSSGLDEFIVNGFIVSIIFDVLVCYGYYLNPDPKFLVIVYTTIIISSVFFGGLIYISKRQVVSNKTSTTRKEETD